MTIAAPKHLMASMLLVVGLEKSKLVTACAARLPKTQTRVATRPKTRVGTPSLTLEMLGLRAPQIVGSRHKGFVDTLLDVSVASYDTDLPTYEG
jgi:hypothetical protein